jgi:TPR repeat protein
MSRSLPRLLSTTGLGLWLTLAAAQAQPVALAFEPPQIEPQAICVSRAPDVEVLARWKAWDGTSLQDWTGPQVESELARLAELDAPGWYDKAMQAIDLLPSIDADFDDTQKTLARIEWMVAAGKQAELADLRLVPELLAQDNTPSPRRQRALAGLLLRGTGIAADPETGLKLLVQAANGGNADAILELVSMQIAGAQVDGWDVPPDMGVTMAFGALVGQLDPEICDRVTRIAREYKNGDVVVANLPLSERWYRFAADLGDMGAAWKVAEFHMRSEGVVKDNAILLKYLTLAAERGSPVAQVNLGRIYETGALVEQDLAQAQALFMQAAEQGDRGGMIRLALFLQEKVKRDPAAMADYRHALDALVARNDAPGWSLLAAADAVLADKGRWSGEVEAMAFLQRAADQGDGMALRRLAGMKMRGVTTEAEFYPLVDDLMASVQIMGTIEPMNDLRAAFTCRAPGAPLLEDAAFWKEQAQATGIETVVFGPAELLELARSQDPLTLARLQSQALSGRASAVAQYLTLIEKGDFSVVQQDFWEEYAQKFPEVLQSRGRLALSLARTVSERAEALDLFRQALAAGETEAGLYLARALLDDEDATPADLIEATELLLPLAEQGMGNALRLLPQADPARFPDMQAVLAQYGDVIDARGDFDALLIAAEYLDDPAARQDHLSRAVALTSCNFDQAARMADFMGKTGNVAGFAQWLQIADILAENEGWRLTRIGDLLMRYGSDSEKAGAEALYQAGYAAGNRVAMLRLLSTYARAEDPKYDPRQATELYIALVMATRPGELPELLVRINDEEPAIRQAVMSAVNPEQIFKVAADAGDPVAMREYAFRLREGNADAAQVAQATALLAQASDKGDVEAMVEYAVSLAFGVGVDPSRDEALMWLNKAAALGNQRALTLVATLGLTESETQ